MDKRIEAFLYDLEMLAPARARIVEECRALFERLAPERQERFIYGGIGIFLEDDLVGGVYVSKSHISLVFSRGDLLEDPDHLLEGAGRFRRHIKLYARDDLYTKKAEFFVSQIVGFDTRRLRHYGSN